MKILVLGAEGQVGRDVCLELAHAHDVIAVPRRALDVRDRDALVRIVKEGRPAAVVNCAAWNDVDGAEAHVADAMAINADAVQGIADVCASYALALVHYSSDFVFDGAARTPYDESSPANPLNAYGRSKLSGERHALACETAHVFRLSSVFGPGMAKGTLGRMLRRLEAGEPVQAFADRVVTPSYSPMVARVTRAAIEGRFAPGLYHCVSRDAANWYDMLEFTRLQLRIPAAPTPARGRGTQLGAAERPLYCALSSRKLQATGVEVLSWRESVSRALPRASLR